MSSYKLSIAIVTRNRPDSLYRTLKSLFLQESKPYEILVSDDSNQQKYILRNQQIVKEFGGKYYKGPQQGLYANRNFVALKCTGTHFRTMDDDHEFPEFHLTRCLEAVESEPEVIWTIGEYFEHEKKRYLPCRIPGQLHPRGFSKSPEKMINYYGISCGATIYPSKLLKNLMLNCELYKFGILYLEYGSRLKKMGYTIKFLPTTYIIHHDDESTASELTNGEIYESKLFAMFCLSFKYNPSIYNLTNTLGQVGYDLMRLEYPLKVVIRAFKNFRNFTKNP